MKALQITFDIDPTRLQRNLIRALSDRDAMLLPNVISELVIDEFRVVLDELVAQGAILRYNGIRRLYSHDERLALREILRKRSIGINVPEVHVALPHSEPPVLVSIGRPQLLRWLAEPRVELRGGMYFLKGTQIPVVTFRRLKTIDKYRIRLHDYVLPTEYLRAVDHHFSNPCSCPNDSLQSYIQEPWGWIVKFRCRICGRTYYCSCFREAFRRCREGASSVDKFSFSLSLEKVPDPDCDNLYRRGLCHMCRRVPSDLRYCDAMYANTVEVGYGPYIHRTAIIKELTFKDAENEIRLELGIPHGSKWFSEFELFRMVKEILDGHRVIYQGRPEWLGQQSLDIYVPSMNLGIEYQGKQHYFPVDFFGGQEALERTQERDRRKRECCEKNGLRLVYFRYDQTLTKTIVEKRLQPFLE